MRFFGPNLPAKGSYFPSKTDKIDTIKFCIFELVFVLNFNLNKEFWIFWTKFTQERYLCSKTEKVNIIIEFRIFKLVLVPNFNWIWRFWFFWPDLPKKGFPSLKQKKWTSHIFYIVLYIQISLVWNFSSNLQFWFFGPDLPRKVFPVKNWKRERHHWILHIQISLGTKFRLKLTSLIFFD